MKKGERDLDNVVLSLRLRGAEAARFWRIMDVAKLRNPYADRSDVLRELLKLSPLAVLTPADVTFFRTGEKETKETGRRSTVKASAIKLDATKETKQGKVGT